MTYQQPQAYTAYTQPYPGHAWQQQSHWHEQQAHTQAAYQPLDYNQQPAPQYYPHQPYLQPQPQPDSSQAPPPPPPLPTDASAAQPPLPAASAPPPTAHPAPLRPVAYTSVSVPRPSSAAQPTNQAHLSPQAWPVSLRNWVARAFTQQGVAGRIEVLKENLKAIIEPLNSRGELWSVDWDKKPLPSPEPQPETRNHSSAPAGALQPITHRAAARLDRDRSLSPESSRKRYRSPSPSPRLKMKGKKGKKANKWGVQNQGKQDVIPPAGDWQDERNRLARMRRFGDGAAVGAVQWRQEQEYVPFTYATEAVESNSFEAGPAVRGTCQTVEKSYFRLTSKPDPSTVRPEPVLKKALDRLVALIQSKDKRANYFYAADQFKGMRQDCTVQHLRNELSASIYEAHARAALENGDMGEYNQCQGQLQQHYEAGISGCRQEFLSYRIIYQAVHAGKDDRVALLTCLQAVTPEDARHSHVKHALQVRQALALGDCTKLASLYLSAPNMGRALLDVILSKVRFTGLKILVKSYAPTLPVSTIALRLGFSKQEHSDDQKESPDETETLERARALPGCSTQVFCGQHFYKTDSIAKETCKQWLTSAGALLVALPGEDDAFAVDCKASVTELKMPQVSAAQPAGPDLAIDDFLARTIL